MTADETMGTGPEWRCHLAPLGVSVLVIANDPALLATVSAAYADWTSETPASRGTIELRLERRDGASESVSDCIRVEGSRLTVDAPCASGWADARSGEARCVVTDMSGALAEIVDTLLLFLLARTGRTPVHAAGVMLGDKALVLAGPSGSGKSTLALAAVRSGLPILSDDTLYVQLDPDPRLWGFPRPIHVFAEDAPPGDHGERLRGGKRKKVVPVSGRGPLFADRSELIVLERGDALHLRRIASEDAVASLSRLDPGFDLLAEASARAIGALAAGGAWRLTLSHDPRAAIALLIDRFG